MSAPRTSSPSLLALVRQDAAFVERLRRGERLGEVARASVLTIVLGAGAYGVAFGIWRAPEAALYAAIKLPLVLLGVSALTSVASAMMAPALRAKLSLRQTVVCILVSFAVTSAILGSVAPIAILFAECAPPADPSLVGLAETDPRVLPSIAVAQGLVLMHTTAIAIAGIAGVVRLLGLLSKLGDPPVVVRRVLVSWIAMQFLVGAELSWILRPFLGRPHLPTSFLLDEAFDGSFFEEIATLGGATFGAFAPSVLVVFVVGVAVWLVVSLRTVPETAAVRLGAGGLAILGPPERAVPWAGVAGASVIGAVVSIRLVPDQTLTEDVICVVCVSPRAAEALAGRIEEARRRVEAGPFRTVGV